MSDEANGASRGTESCGDGRERGDPPDPIAELLAVLERDYATLLIKLSAYLRSPEAAADALHDTYVKLRARPPVSDLRRPEAYLYRMAINLALNSRRKDAPIVSAERFGLEDLPDSIPDPERSALAVREMEHTFAALHELPSKRREIFLARLSRGDLDETLAAIRMRL